MTSLSVSLIRRLAADLLLHRAGHGRWPSAGVKPRRLPKSIIIAASARRGRSRDAVFDGLLIAIILDDAVRSSIDIIRFDHQDYGVAATLGETVRDKYNGEAPPSGMPWMRPW